MGNSIGEWLAWLQQRWLHWRARRHSIPVIVLVSDPTTRGTLEGEIDIGLRRLRRLTALGVTGDVAVVIQHSLAAERPLAGCYQTGQQVDGHPFSLLRLALHLDGRALDKDEVLAVLAEQWIGLALQQSGALSVLVPVDLQPVAPRPSSPASGDPLAPHPNGRTRLA